MASWETIRSTLLLCSVAMLLIVKGSEAKEFVVGNQVGWTNYDLKSFEVPNYVDWAASQRVTVGDFVVFKYSKGMHNVNQLPNRAAYLGCDFSRASVLDAGETGVYIWRASRAGVYYFGCNKQVEEEGNHCGSGQKLALVVRSTAAAAELLGAPAAPPVSIRAPRAESAAAPPPSATSASASPISGRIHAVGGCFVMAAVLAALCWL